MRWAVAPSRSADGATRLLVNSHQPLTGPVAWYEAFQDAYAELNAQLDRGEVPAIDDYAAESPGEFFAVVSEYYFELPAALRRAYPAVFSQLDAFYRPPSTPGGD